ncbi:Uncharacterized membrane protein [Roseomonas rosea]|uniref:Uncharacterized membrane protein n=1 Tax=Muricoccus roseus TaxID=198092 RepID=A0A1M6PNB4_9PROT|nr:DUF2306 domain-containing protein [Roseomonas rosea]SHK09402.1 Uncharacterized membrane protein [Roseomonas rosea]
MTIPLPVLVHLGFSAFAMLAVPLALLLPRLGLAGHRPLGRIAALALAGAALSALFVARDGLSPLHLLALVLLVTLARAVVMVRQGRIAAHRRMMLIAAASLYVAGGAAIFMPGRVAHRLLFG